MNNKDTLYYSNLRNIGDHVCLMITTCVAKSNHYWHP